MTQPRSRAYHVLSSYNTEAIDANAVKLRAAVRHIHTDVHVTYGSRRMCAELIAQGFSVGRYKVRSLIQALQLKAKRPKEHRYPAAGKPSQIAPNSLNRQFTQALTTHIELVIILMLGQVRAGFT